MKTGCLIAVLGVVVLVVVVLGLVFWLTGDAVTSAESFLNLLSEGKIEEAYQSASTSFHSQQDLASFSAVVEQTGLERYQSASWSNRSVQNSEASLEGTVTTLDGGTIPLTVQLVKENGQWRVLSLRTVPGGAHIGGGGQQLPPEAQLVSLVNQTMADFNRSLLSKEFESFYPTISRLWQNQTSPGQLQQAFQHLLDQSVDFSSIQGITPLFNQPSRFDENGLLLIGGYYPSTPFNVTFDLKYIYEDPDWRLVGISVKTAAASQNVNAPSVPGDEVAAACDQALRLLARFPGARVNRHPNSTFEYEGESYTGCVGVVEGDSSRLPADKIVGEDFYPQEGSDLAAMGWTASNEADGPDGSFYQVNRGDVFCAIESRWDGGDDSGSTDVPATSIQITVQCASTR